MKISVGIVDDHELFLKSLSLLLSTIDDVTVSVEASNGKVLLRKLEGEDQLPDILLLDVNMPEMDGFETSKILHEKYPALHLIALSMNDDEATIIRMIKAGCCSYLLKDISPSELETALRQVVIRGYYNSDKTILDFRKLLDNGQNPKSLKLTDKERHMLHSMCSDKPYKLIASEAGLSERTIDGYRETLFQKFEVQSRVGLVLEAIKGGFVKV